jgi:uncharacterized protein YggL (DUF469 family)
MNAIVFLEQIEFPKSDCQDNMRNSVISAINRSASLNDTQQEFIKGWFKTQPFKNWHQSDRTDTICSLATYINTCH